MKLTVTNELPPYGMPPAGAVGNKPEYVEPDMEEIFAMMNAEGPADGMGPMGGPPPAPDLLNDNETMFVVKDGRTENRVNEKAALSGTFTAEYASNVSFATEAPEVNGLTVAGDSRYTIENSKLRAVGNGKNDFAGNGAVIMSMDNAELTLKNVDIETSGCIRPCTFAADNSTLRVYDSVLNANGGELPADYKPVIGSGMMTPPPGLEIGGTCRTHLSVGNSRSYFYNSKIIADGWAALSTDASEGDLYLEANDCQVICRNSGYGTYSDGGCNVVFNRCKVDCATHGAIMAGECSIAWNDCDVKAGDYGVMVHSVMGVTCETADLRLCGGRYEIGKDMVLVKSQNIYVSISDLEAEVGSCIIHSIVSSDSCATKVKDGEKVYGVKCAISGCNIKGDILHEDTQRTMAVSLYGTKLTGKITEAYISMDAESTWTATGNSVVGLAGEISVNRIDAAAGITIKAVACEGCTLSGEYTLKSGGILSVTR